MTSSLEIITSLVDNAATIVQSFDKKYVVTKYAPTLNIERGIYSAQVLPDEIVNRELTGRQNLPNITINIVFYYVMDSEDDYTEKWIIFLNNANAILAALYEKANIPDNVSTVSIDMDFDNPLTDNARINLISVVMSCEYRVFASS